MDPDEWAQVFEAAWRAIPSQCEPAANALALALKAMQDECAVITRQREARHG